MSNVVRATHRFLRTRELVFSETSKEGVYQVHNHEGMDLDEIREVLAVRMTKVFGFTPKFRLARGLKNSDNVYVRIFVAEGIWQ